MKSVLETQKNGITKSSVSKHENCRIRLAQPHDVDSIAHLINYYAQQGEMLPRQLKSISEHLGGFLIAEIGNEVVGCAALHIWADGTCEVRSLAVGREWRGQKIGERLLMQLVELAKSRRSTLLFALTLRPSFFDKFGFVRLEKQVLKLKVEGDCAVCPFKLGCQEISVGLML